MVMSPEVLALLEDMLETGRTAEDVCRERPELLSEVRRRWKSFRLVDEAVAALLPDTQLAPAAGPTAPSRTARTCRRSPATGSKLSSGAAAWASSTAPAR
jgi:hypothetical protein